MDIILKDNFLNIKVSSKILNVPLNISLIHQVIRSYRFNLRKGNVSQKSRSEVKGSKKKPWKQKGTGRARCGSIKSPLWRSGGIIFANKPKKYFLKVNRKMYISAFKNILSELFRQSRLHIINDINIKKPKTKEFIEKFNFINLDKLLIIVHNYEKNLFLSSRNLYNVYVCLVNNLNIINLIKYKNIIFTLKSFKIIEDKLINV